MKVKELIKALKKCDQEAEVYTEGSSTNEIFRVAQYSKKSSTYKAVYIGDEFYYVDDGLLGEYNKELIAGEPENLL